MVLLYNVSRGNACLQVIPACPQYLKLLQSGRKIYIIIALIAYVNIHIPPPVVGQAFFGALMFAKVKELPLLPTVASTCSCATPPRLHYFTDGQGIGCGYKVKPFVKKNLIPRRTGLSTKKIAFYVTWCFLCKVSSQKIFVNEL
ncbi:MAG: hypothetical protein R2796_06240 [Chitinophagaceae bacterium]